MAMLAPWAAAATGYGAAAPAMAGSLLMQPALHANLAKALCVGVAVAYPAYKSHKAMASAGAPSTLTALFGLREGDDPRDFWLTYWMSFGAFCSVERVLDASLGWFPLYHHAKLGFLVWLQWPGPSGGAQRIYHNAVKPALEHNADDIDPAVAKVEGEIANAIQRNERELRYVADAASSYARRAWHFLRDTIDAIVAPSQDE